MRIDNYGRPQFDPQSNPVKRPEPAKKTSSQTEKTSDNTQSRAQRIENLKQQFAAGKPIDVNQLANKLVESGIFFDEKA